MKFMECSSLLYDELSFKFIWKLCKTYYFFEILVSYIGVFGAGKSFLLAVVIIYLVELFKASDALNQHRWDQFIYFVEKRSDCQNIKPWFKLASTIVQVLVATPLYKHRHTVLSLPIENSKEWLTLHKVFKHQLHKLASAVGVKLSVYLSAIAARKNAQSNLSELLCMWKSTF